MADSKGPDRVTTLPTHKFDIEDDAMQYAQEVEQQLEADSNSLMRLGKKPVLTRSFTFWPMLGFSCTVLVTWEGILTTFQILYEAGGPAGAVWGFLIVWMGMLCTYACISELASMAPTAGGQYHWVSMLAPESCQKFLSYIAGWLTVAGWQAACASSAYSTGIFIQGLIALCNPGYEPQNWRNTLLAYAVLTFAVVINVMATTSLAKFEGLILILHITGFVAICVPLIYLAPHNSASDVFTTFETLNGYPTQSYSFFIGLAGASYPFVGADCAVHMAEEIRNAATVVPRAIMMSIVINGSLGFAMIIALMFCVGPLADVPSVVLGTNFEFPFIQVFYDATRSTAGTAVMASLILTMGISAIVGLVASCSRQLWAFARDRSVPYWQFISKVDSRTAIPIPAVGATVLISVLLALIGIGASKGSAIAFGEVVSLTVVALYASYILPLCLLLWRRCTNGIYNDVNEVPPGNNAVVNTHGASLVWGPFRLRGYFGIFVNAFAICFMIVVFLFAFWPSNLPVDKENMNYASVVFFAAILFSVLYYFAYARKVYDGPIVEW